MVPTKSNNKSYTVKKQIFFLRILICCVAIQPLLLFAQRGPDAFSSALAEQQGLNFAFPTDNGLFKAKKEGKYSFVDSSGRLGRQWQWYDEVGHFWNGLALVRTGNRWGACSPDGKLLIPVTQDSLALTFSGQKVWFSEAGKWGMIDAASGTVALQPQYQVSQYNCATGSFPCHTWVAGQGSKWGLLRIDGQWVAPAKYDWIYSQGTATLAYTRDGGLGFMDTTGKELIGPILDEEMAYHDLFFKNGKLWVRQNELWGLLNLQGKWLIQPTYQAVRQSFMERSGAWVSVEPGVWGFVDTLGRYVIPPLKMDESPAPERNGDLALVSQGGKRGVVGSDGKWIFEPREGRVQYSGGLFLLEDEQGKPYCVDRSGKVKVPASEKILTRSGDFFYVYQDGHWTFVDPTGKWQKPLRVEAITEFKHGLAYAKQGGKWGLLKSNGKWLVPAGFDDAHFDAYRLLGGALPQGRGSAFVPSIVSLDDTQLGASRENQLFWLKQGQVWRLADSTGKLMPKLSLKAPQKVDILSLKAFRMATPTGMWQIYRFDGTRLSELGFEDVTNLLPIEDRKGYSVKKNGKWGFLDEQGKLAFPFFADRSFTVDNIRGGKTFIECFRTEFWLGRDWRYSTR